MSASASIFSDFNLPNSTTWFYFSFLLAVALFFKFSRLISIRNWDVLTLFLLVPGILLIQQARLQNERAEFRAEHVAALVAASGNSNLGAGIGEAVRQAQETSGLVADRAGTLWLGYLWLLCGSAVFLVRCLVDLVLESRPAIAPNLSFGGLAWLACALFVCLAAVAYRPEVAPHPFSPLPLGERGKRGEGDVVAPLHAAQTVAASADQVAAVGRDSTALHLARRSLGVWPERSFALLCHLAVVAGLIVIGVRHYRDALAGMAAATFYLMLPYTGLYVGQAHHVWPMALIVWAVACYRWPTVAGVLIGVAAVTSYFPLLILPVWIGFYWRRGSARFFTSFFLSTALGLGIVGAILWHNGDLAANVREALSLSAWQPWKVPTTEGFWTGVHWAYRIPIFIAYVAFVAVTAFWPCPKNLAHTVALSAAVLIGLQFWYADQGGVYVLWYLPLFLLMAFRPKLSERRPPIVKPENDWLFRFCRWLIVLATRSLPRAHTILFGRIGSFSRPR